MRHNSILTAAATLLASATFANAADLASAEAPVAPSETVSAVYDWSGFYIGAQGGYGWNRLEARNLVDGTEERVNANGGFFGAHAGYNFQQGSWVFGAEADVNRNWAKVDGGELSNYWDGSIRGRVGYALDKTLIYGTGGYALANLESTSDLGVKENHSLNGWTIGAGVEQVVFQNVSARLEYRYTDFGTKRINDFDFDMNKHTVGVGLSVKF